MPLSFKLSIGAVLAAVSALGQAPAGPPRADSLPDSLGHQVWQADAGLPQNSVQAILQTRDGYLWVGTQSGLARFDGVKFRVFDPTYSSGLPDRNIQALAESPDGTLWVGTISGLARYRGDRFTPVGLPGAPRASVLSLEADRDGTVWAGTGKALFHISGAGAAEPAYDPQQPMRVRALARDAQGRLLLGTGEGLKRLVGRSLEPVPEAREAAGLTMAILQEPDGATWLGSSTGLFRLSGGAARQFGEADGLSNAAVRSLLRTRKGDIWVGTQGGVFLFASGRFTRYDKGELLEDAFILALCEDREGSIWIGTDRSGLHRLKQDRVTLLGREAGLTDDFVWTVLADREGRVWVGTAKGVLARRNPGEGRFTVVASASAPILTLARDSEGTLWAGTLGRGVMRWNARGSTWITMRDGLESESVFALCPDRDGAMWIGTAGGGLSRWQSGKLTMLGLKDGNPFRFIRTLALDRDGSLWIGCFEGGLAVLHDGKFRTYTTADGLAHDAVLSILPDAEGAVWVGTYGGLSRFKNGAWTSYRARDGLFDEVVLTILDDGRGNLWLSGNHGISRISKAELTAFAEKRAGVIHSTVFGAPDGLRAECNGGGPGSSVTADGRLLFATAKGIADIDPLRLPKNTIPPLVVIETAIADGRAIPLTPSARAPEGNGALEIHYAATSFRSPEQVRFRYRLVGFDRGWVEAGSRRAAYYTNLPPGAYTFEVLAQNEDGVASLRAASQAIVLTPHFYQTIWFYLGCGLIALAAAAAGYRYRVAQLETREGLRAALAEAQLHALRQQLRPHFLFNTLNTLLPLIGQDPELARRMVFQIGDLLRLNLKTEPDQVIPLEAELELLEGYLAIERMRFRDRLRVDYDIDAQVRAALVPTFLLQPLIENAIKHGVGRNPGAGIVTLSARGERQTLRLEIRNSGCDVPAVPRPESDGIGLKNTRERLHWLYGPDHSFDFFLCAGGARISIVLPLTFPAADRPAAPQSEGAAT